MIVYCRTSRWSEAQEQEQKVWASPSPTSTRVSKLSLDKGSELPPTGMDLPVEDDREEEEAEEQEQAKYEQPQHQHLQATLGQGQQASLLLLTPEY